MYLRISNSKNLLLVITLMLLLNIGCNNNVNSTRKKGEKNQQLNSSNKNKKLRVEPASQSKGARKSDPGTQNCGRITIDSYFHKKKDPDSTGSKNVFSSLPNTPTSNSILTPNSTSTLSSSSGKQVDSKKKLSSTTTSSKSNQKNNVNKKRKAEELESEEETDNQTVETEENDEVIEKENKKTSEIISLSKKFKTNNTTKQKESLKVSTPLPKDTSTPRSSSGKQVDSKKQLSSTTTSSKSNQKNNVNKKRKAEELESEEETIDQAAKTKDADEVIEEKKNKVVKIVLLKSEIKKFEEAYISEEKLNLKRKSTQEQGENSEITTASFSIPGLESTSIYPAMLVLEKKTNLQALWLRDIYTYCKKRTIVNLVIPTFKEEIKSGLIFLEVSGRKFAYVFGRSGLSLLRNSAIERNFGLIVSVNNMHPKTRISTLGSVTRGYNSSYNYSSYNIPKAPEQFNLTNKTVTSMRLDHNFQEKERVDYSGPQAIVFVPERHSINDYPETCNNLLELYAKEDYKTKLPGLDNLQPIDTECDLKKELDDSLKTIIGTKESIWHLTPFYLDNIHTENFETTFYRLVHKKSKELSDIIGTYSTLEEVASKMRTVNKLSVNKCKNNFKIQILDTNKEFIKQFPVYKFLAAEVELKGRNYTLMNGKWYQIKQEHYEEVNNYINRYFLSDKELPCLEPVAASILKKQNSNKSDYMEKEYCIHTATKKGSKFLLMDRRCIKLDPSPDPYHLNNKGETSDLIYYDPTESEQRYFIHAKNWTGSNTFSHLLQQGVVSTTCILNKEIYRKEARDLYVQDELLEEIITQIYNNNTRKKEKEKSYYISQIQQQNKTGKIDLTWFDKFLIKEIEKISGIKPKTREIIINNWKKGIKKKGEEAPEKAINNLADVIKKLIDKHHLSSFKQALKPYLDLSKSNIIAIKKVINNYLTITSEELDAFCNNLSDIKKSIQTRIEAAIPTSNFNPSNFTIIYAFFHKETRQRLSDYLPFFSRETLKNTLEKLHEGGINVKIKRIKISSADGQTDLSNYFSPFSSTQNESTQKDSSPTKQPNVNFSSKNNTQSQNVEEEDVSDNEEDEEKPIDGENENGEEGEDAGDKEKNESEDESEDNEEDELKEYNFTKLKVTQRKNGIKELPIFDSPIHTTDGKSGIGLRLSNDSLVLQNVSGDGMNCFFNAIGLKREEQIQKLREYKNDAIVRYMIGFDIVSTVEDPQEVNGLDKKIKEAINYSLYKRQMEGVEKLETDQASELSKQNKDSNKTNPSLLPKNLKTAFIDQQKENIKGELKIVSRTLRAYNAFIDNFIAKNKMIGLINNVQDAGSYTIIDAIAYINKLGIVVYRDTEDMEYLEILHQFIPQNATKVVYLYHSGVHFQTFVPKKIEKPHK